MKPPPPLVCAGRLVDDQGEPTGEPCGRTYCGKGATTRTVALVREQARAAGWSVAGPLPFCGRCRKPDPAITAGLTNPPKEQ